MMDFTQNQKKRYRKKIDDCVKQALTLQMKIRIKWATRPRKQVRLIQVTPNSRIQVYSFTLYTYIEEMLCTKVSAMNMNVYFKNKCWAKRSPNLKGTRWDRYRLFPLHKQCSHEISTHGSLTLFISLSHHPASFSTWHLPGPATLTYLSVSLPQ